MKGHKGYFAYVFKMIEYFKNNDSWHYQYLAESNPLVKLYYLVACRDISYLIIISDVYLERIKLT